MIRSKMKSTWMLGLLLLLGSCQQKGPASGRVEMKGESDSLSVRHGQENALSVSDEYPEGYVPVPGIRYQANYLTGNPERLDVKAALRNVRPLKLSQLGSQLDFMVFKDVKGGIFRLIPIEEGCLGVGIGGIWLLDGNLKMIRMLFRNDVDITEENGFTNFQTKRYINPDYYEKSSRTLIGVLYDQRDKKNPKSFVRLSLKDLLSASRPLTPDDIHKRAGISGNYLLGMADGYATWTRFTNDVYTFNLRGDTLCHFTIGEKVNYPPRGNGSYRSGEQATVYHYKGCPMIIMPYGNTVYRMTDASTLEPVYELDFGTLHRATGEEVVGGADVDNAYFLSDWVETDSYVFMHVEKGYDCPYARDKKQVTLYSLIYDKRSKAFFSLPQAEETVHPCPEPDLPDGIPFWPRKGFSEKQLATFTTGWKLSKSSPEVFKRILALQGTEKETTSLIITLK